jgi:hypothetical protein
MGGRSTDLCDEQIHAPFERRAFMKRLSSNGDFASFGSGP